MSGLEFQTLNVDFSLPVQLMLPTDQPTDTSALTGNPEPHKLPYNLLAINLLQLLAILLTCLAKNSPSTKSSEASIERMGNTVDTFTSRGNDVIR